MLVLSRKQSQQVIIDGQIKIEVLKIKGNTVRLGISAPANVKVLRGELKPFGLDSGDENETQQVMECLIPMAQVAQAS